MSISCILHGKKTIYDDKVKPQIVKFYDVTKGRTDIVDQLNDCYKLGYGYGRWVMVALFYIIDTSRVNRKTIWCLKHKEDISKLSSCDSEWNLAKASALPHVRRQKLHGLASVLQLQTKILLRTALEVSEPVPNIKNRYQRTGKSNRCKTNGDNNVSHVIKIFVEHIL